MSRRYHSREPVFVSVTGITGNYGFLTNLTAGDQGELGHTALAQAGGPVVFGANRPKPPRAVKKDTTGSVSSFIDSGKLGSVPQGWRITKSGKASISATDPSSSIKKTVRMCVSVGQIKWGWDMPLETYNKIGQGTLQTLGVEVLTGACWYKANRIDASGTPYNRPPRVMTISTGEGGVDSLSTFCDPTKLDSLPVGWSPID